MKVKLMIFFLLKIMNLVKLLLIKGFINVDMYLFMSIY